VTPTANPEGKSSLNSGGGPPKTGQNSGVSSRGPVVSGLVGDMGRVLSDAGPDADLLTTKFCVAPTDSRPRCAGVNSSSASRATFAEPNVAALETVSTTAPIGY
jgi:hypothetical protein